METEILYVLICAFLVLFAGLMSGLTLGLLSLDTLELKALESSGTVVESAHAKRILSVVQNPHFTLVTLLLWNAIALEALPIFLNQLVDETAAIAISVTMVLLFGEIFPQALCYRYKTIIGAYSAHFVRVLRRLSSPISWPISKLLDYVMGEKEHPILRRGYLKTAVTLGSSKESIEGDLTQDEVKIINGALDMQAKAVKKAMTPMEKVYMVSSDRIINKEFIKEIVQTGHSRIPVYSGDSKNDIIGLILVKELLTVDQEESKTVRDLGLRTIACLPSNLPMYDVLHLFKTGRSHMAVLTDSQPGSASDPTNDHISSSSNIQFTADHPVGIIALEDLIEELLQTEIVDETDYYTDNTQQHRVSVNNVDSDLPPRVRKWIPLFTPGPRRLALSNSLRNNRTSSASNEGQDFLVVPLLTSSNEYA